MTIETTLRALGPIGSLCPDCREVLAALVGLGDTTHQTPIPLTPLRRLLHEDFFDARTLVIVNHVTGWSSDLLIDFLPTAAYE